MDDHEHPHPHPHPHGESQPQAAKPATVPLTPVAAEQLEAIHGLLRDVGFRVKTAALVEAALAELREQFEDKEKAVAIVRKRVPPHSVVFPP
ncbi:MAG: hypothetical protein ACRENA_06575 [Vulcanimicrobiaceae bacterium]